MTDRTTESLLARRALAEKATPGPWKKRIALLRGYVVDAIWDCNGDLIADTERSPLRCDEESNAAHIAANSPDVVMADIDEIIRLRREVRRLEDESKDAHSVKALDFACYLLELACQRHHCADCFLRQRRVCPKYANGEPIEIELESVSLADWSRFLRARYE